jgi:hypothetical protein
VSQVPVTVLPRPMSSARMPPLMAVALDSLSTIHFTPSWTRSTNSERKRVRIKVPGRVCWWLSRRYQLIGQQSDSEVLAQLAQGSR